MAKDENDLIEDIDVLKENAYELALNSDNSLTSVQIEKVKRLEFKSKTKRVLAQRVGYRCSCPECKAVTIGPGNKPGSVVVLGEAAHIVGAIRKDDGLSPRADASKTEDEIRDLDNGIWLCRNHHKLVDLKFSTFTVDVLREWKRQAEEKQEELLKKQESDFVENYVYPNISVDKGINTTKFSKSEWCLLAYLIEYNYKITRVCYKDFYGDENGNFFTEYQNWMSENSIDSKISGISFTAYHNDIMSDIREIVNKLTGLIKINNDGLDFGQKFDDFCNELFEDEEALEKLKKQLSKV